MTNRTMTVYLPNGARYFHTDSIAPVDETREEDHWVAQGYVVVFTESAAVDANLDFGCEATVAQLAADPHRKNHDAP